MDFAVFIEGERDDVPVGRSKADVGDIVGGKRAGGEGERKENGGVADNFWVRDTTVEAREISVVLNNASNSIKKRTAFLDQQYRIPLTFIKDIFTPYLFKILYTYCDCFCHSIPLTSL